MTDALHVLMVEDSSTDAALILRELRRGGREVTSERVETPEAMRAALKQGAWHAVTSDWTMPRFSGLAALAVMKEMQLDLPFIIVSGTVGEESAVEAMRAGAHDYVLKDKLARLPVALERELRDHGQRVDNRRHELELRGLERRYRRIIETTNEGVFISDAAGHLSFASARLESMLGYEPGELLGKPLRSLLCEADLASAAESMDRRRRGIAESGEFRLKRKDGAELPVLRSSNPIIDDEGRFDGMFAMVMDISDRKRAEEGLRRTEEQLRHGQKMEAVGRLAGGVAHDFNNVLSVILTYAEMLLLELPPGEAMHDDVAEMHKAGKRAAELTRQLLMFSRQQVLAPKVLDLNDVLASMDRMLQRVLGADVELVSVPTRPLDTVRADPSSLEQVIMNLVVNARDAMPTGGRLTMETSNVVLDEAYAQAHVGAKPGPHVMLAITDTGTGIDKATLGRIFEPFFTTKESGKGTGLGLSTVFGVVQQSGGSIWVYSEVGLGTTFKVYLPRAQGAVDVADGNTRPTMLRGSETILLVEDDDQVRAVAHSILRRHGYRVIEARNAGEALLHSEEYQGTIHLLLSDVVMPQMSGPVLARRLASARPAMKVLCMSGYTDDSIVRHGVLAAETQYLQKPITPGTLTAKVREVLDAPAMPRAQGTGAA